MTAVLSENYAGCHLHRNGDSIFRSVRALRARLRKALTKKNYGKLDPRNYFRRALRLSHRRDDPY